MDAILAPIMWVVAWIMYGSHQFFTLIGFPDGPGVAWILSIVALTVMMRAAMIPLFVKQIRSSRAMQILQPELQAIQKRYKGKSDPASREAMSRETMDLYKKHGTNPFSSCMPILLQSPIFFALFRVLANITNVAAGTHDAIGPIHQQVAQDIEGTSLFGAHLSDVFMTTGSTTARVVIIVLIVLMSATTFFTQRQLTMKNMPKAALEGPQANMQKMMLYAMPLIFAVSGVNFPLGVLIYWTTTNVWSMGQQFYTINRMPAPGSPAEKALLEKKARKAAAKGKDLTEEQELLLNPTPRGQRTQPVRKNRRKKKG
ncbi:MAG: membrane protein insertase YidC [Cellulomonadaceae bacterium]|jgi:YidC/Oxa1 family membrane protein insertase|nr:membrane protein insertase YidC [Cellulomonadaceae bacterium]